MRKLAFLLIFILCALAGAESQVSQQPRTTAPAGISSPTGEFDFLQVNAGGAFWNYGTTYLGNGQDDYITGVGLVDRSWIPAASGTRVLGSGTLYWDAYLDDVVANGITLDEQLTLQRGTGVNLQNDGSTILGSNIGLDYVQMQAYILGNLIPDASASTSSKLGSAAKPWDAYLASATVGTRLTVNQVDADTNLSLYTQFISPLLVSGGYIWSLGGSVAADTELVAGVADTSNGIVRAHGNATTTPGTQYLYNGGTQDVPYDYFRWLPTQYALTLATNAGTPYSFGGNGSLSLASLAASGTGEFNSTVNVKSNILTVGVEDTTQGLPTFYGDGDVGGAAITLENGANEDSTVNAWGLAAQGNNFYIGYTGNTDAAIFNNAGGLGLDGKLTVPYLTNSGVTNAGTLRAETTTIYGPINQTTATANLGGTVNAGPLKATSATVYGNVTATTGTGSFQKMAVSGTWINTYGPANVSNLVVSGTSLLTGAVNLSSTLTMPDSNALTLSPGETIIGNSNYTQIDGTSGGIGKAGAAETFRWTSAALAVAAGKNLTVGGTATSTGLFYGSVTNVGPFTQPSILGGPEYAFYAGVACSSTWGWVAPGNGSIIGITGRVAAASTVSLYKNGSTVWTAYTSVGAVTFHAYQAKGTDTFVAGDVIAIYTTGATANGDHYDLQVTLDSFPASGP